MPYVISLRYRVQPQVTKKQKNRLSGILLFTLLGRPTLYGHARATRCALDFRYRKYVKERAALAT